MTITVDALLGGAAFVTVNFAFISLAISFHQRMPVLPLLKEEVRLVGPGVRDPGVPRGARRRALGDGSRACSCSWPGRSSPSRSTSARRSRRGARRATRTRTASRCIGNNRAYELGLATALDAAYEDGTTLSLCLVDVDDFKQINDTYGHPLGDQVLVEVARLLDTGSDCVGTFRFGGDEFAVVLACGKATGAGSRRGALPTHSSSAEFSHGAERDGERRHRHLPGARGATSEALERAADAALYWAKQHGKNRFCAYSPVDRRGLKPRQSSSVASSTRRGCERQRISSASSTRRTSTRARTPSASRCSSRRSPVSSSCDDEQVEQLKVAGRLHDLGKIAIPDSVLQKPGEL